MSSATSDKISGIQDVLDRLYPDPPVPLDSLNEFTFLVAVVLSAQTTDGKVNQVTKELFRLAKTPHEMAKLDQNTVLNIIQPVGLAPKKSEYIVKLSQMLVDDFGGILPATYKELESLPGVGHKTASVIMSQIHKVPSIAVDTHVHRLALRWGLSQDQRNVDNVQKDLCSVFPEACWNKLHLQMIYFGREYCTAKNHENTGCPICSWVHNKARGPPTSLAHFEAKRVTKGIVYYADRLRELEADPEISMHSPFKKSAGVKVETTATAVLQMDMAAEENEGDFDFIPKSKAAKKTKVVREEVPVSSTDKMPVKKKRKL